MENTVSNLIEQAEAAMREAVSLRKQAEALSASEDGLSAEQEAEFDGLIAEADAKEGESKTLRARAEKIRKNAEALAAAKTQPKPKAPGLDVPVLDAPARESAQDDPTFGYKSFAHFAADVFKAGPQELAHSEGLRISAAAGTGLNQAIGSDGGYLVPPSFSTTIWDGMRDDVNNLLPLTDQYTVEGESLTMAANAETSRVAGSRYGGVRGYWIAELEQITSSAPTFADEAGAAGAGGARVRQRQAAAQQPRGPRAVPDPRRDGGDHLPHERRDRERHRRRAAHGHPERRLRGQRHRRDGPGRDHDRQGERRQDVGASAPALLGERALVH